jgi:hypothetical protein
MTRTAGALARLIAIEDRPGRALAAAAFGVLAVHWAFILSFVVPRLGTLGFLRLHYSASLGVDWVGEWWKIFSFPAFGLAVFFANVALASTLGRANRMQAALVLGGTLVVEAFLAVAGVIATLLNS